MRDFFFAAFGLGVGVCPRFDFDDALDSGVSRGVGDATGSSSSPDFSLLVLRSALGLGDFLGVTEASEARCLFADLLVAVFALGVGDFFGLGDEALILFDSDSSRRLFCSSLTCARTRPVTIAPRASAVASQMRKRTTATERNRARDAINSEDFRESTESLKNLKRFTTRNKSSSIAFVTFVTSASYSRRARGRLRCERRSPAHSFAFPPKDCVQFASQQQQETSQVHPGEQHNDGRQR